MQPDPKQKKKAEKLMKIVEAGGRKAELEIANQVDELENKVDELLPSVKAIIAQVKGEDADPKEVAKFLAEDADFISQIKPKDGDDYILTEQDKVDIAKSIPVPVVEKVIEKKEVIREIPIIKTEIKEVQMLDEKKLEQSLPKYGEVFRDGLELLEGEERLDAKAIKNLPEVTRTIGTKAGWGAHPLMIQDDGTTKAKNARTLNFTGGAITVSADGTINISVAKKRVTTVADATSITPNVSTTDIVKQTNTQATGTLTINSPTGSANDWQALVFEISATNEQTLSFSSAYIDGDVPMPTTARAGVMETYFFAWNATKSKHIFTGKVGNF